MKIKAKELKPDMWISVDEGETLIGLISDVSIFDDNVTVSFCSDVWYSHVKYNLEDEVRIFNVN